MNTVPSVWDINISMMMFLILACSLLNYSFKKMTMINWGEIWGRYWSIILYGDTNPYESRKMTVYDDDKHGWNGKHAPVFSYPEMEQKPLSTDIIDVCDPNDNMNDLFMDWDASD